MDASEPGALEMVVEPGGAGADGIALRAKQITLPLGQQCRVRAELLRKQLRRNPVEVVGGEMDLQPAGFVARLIPAEQTTWRQRELGNVFQILAHHLNGKIP